VDRIIVVGRASVVTQGMTFSRRSADLAAALLVLGLSVGPGPARANGVFALEGSWAVAQATVNGAARADPKMLNATWTFRGIELVVQNAHGERLRAALTFDATAEPPAFHVTPLDPPGERALWIIWARQGDELRLAFYDGVDRRPEDFGPRRKLVVLTLVPARGAATPAALDPCDILRGAGVELLLGAPTRAQPASRRASSPGSSCALDRTDGSRAISLTLVAPPAGPAYVDAARREAQADRRMQIEEEPALGAGAFSGARGWTVVVVAHRGGTAMMLKFEALGVDRVELRRFAARVLDAL
jgi:uncharacterized protein (TIGR03067 family)